MPSSTDWKIVLVDDESDIREVLALVLSQDGFQVRTAADGVEGLALCRSFAPQIVITDIRMPRMDGIALLEALKASDPDIEVIVVTAFGEMDLAVRALQLDASDFITKPVSEPAVRVALGRARARHASRRELKEHAAFLEKENARTSRELRQTYSLQKNLIESSMDGIMGCDPDGRVILFNGRMEKMAGVPREEAVQGMSLDRFFGVEGLERLQAAFAGPGHGGRNRLLLYETFLLDRDRQKVPVQLSASALGGEAPGGGMVLFLRDLRQIRRLERELADQAGILQQDKLMALGRLAASVAHEINNPLSGVLNYVRLMNRILTQSGPTPADREKFRQYLELVESETARCAQIISSLLAFSRKAAPSFAVIQVKDLIDRSLVLCRHRLEMSRIRFETAISPGIPPLWADPNQLQQCLINLVFNALDALEAGGCVWITAGHLREEKTVFIRVRDDGPGIREEDLPYIFEPFFTTKKEGFGVGLGLATVYGIMERHGGSVTVDSSPGAGTCFELRLPAADREESP